MKVVGITGRSGCGKSSATNFLREKGYPCIDADLVAREVLLPGSPCIAQLQQVFGADIADENGTVRRRLLADRAFATPEGTAALTDITQPEILRRIDAALDEARRGGANLAFVDGAVIVGTPFEARCDALILVTAPYETSVARICARDGSRPRWPAAVWMRTTRWKRCAPPPRQSWPTTARLIPCAKSCDPF